MNNQKEYENIKNVEEMGNIISEKNETKRLLQECRWDELREHLQKLNSKYFAETIVYNAVNTNPPQTLQENATNCITFLDTLLAAKAAKGNR